VGPADQSPIFFVLTNTIAPQTSSSCYQRSLSQSETGTLAEGIQDFLIVSRSDSTAGHYPIETDVIAEELGPLMLIS